VTLRTTQAVSSRIIASIVVRPLHKMPKGLFIVTCFSPLPSPLRTESPQKSGLTGSFLAGLVRYLPSFQYPALRLLLPYQMLPLWQLLVVPHSCPRLCCAACNALDFIAACSLQKEFLKEFILFIDILSSQKARILHRQLQSSLDITVRSTMAFRNALAAFEVTSNLVFILWVAIGKLVQKGSQTEIFEWVTDVLYAASRVGKLGNGPSSFCS
jgi:hypothetical protein